MRHRWKLLALCGYSLLIRTSLVGANEQTAVLGLRSLVDSAVAGIPVVVELETRNPGKRDVVAFDLVDPYLSFTSWVWTSSDGKLHKVSLKDYHYGALPEPMTPPPVRLKPGESKRWMTTVPTPTTFGGVERWKLTVLIRPPPAYGGHPQRASIELRGRDVESPCVAQAITASLSQAAMLEFARNDVLLRLRAEGKLDQIRICAQKGEITAGLILLSNALLTGEGIVERLHALRGGPPEAKCLRNFLVILYGQGGGATKRPAKESQAILEEMNGDGCLTNALRELFTQRKADEMD